MAHIQNLRRSLLRTALPVIGAGLAIAGLVGPPAGAEQRRAAAAGADVCTGVSVGPATEVVSDATRDRLGLNGWPDGSLNVQRQDDGTYRFYTAAAFDGPNPAHPQRNVITQGTLDDPVRDGVVSSSQIKGLPDGYSWAGGGPIYRDPDSGIVLEVLHLEQSFGDGKFYSELHLGRLDPATGEVTYLGPLVRPELTRDQALENADLGLSRLSVAKDDSGTAYFRLYFPDFRLQDGHQVSTSLSVARAPVRDVLDAAAKGTVVPWQKYSGDGNWDAPALGGHAADLEPGRPMAWAPQVAHSDALGGYVMAAADSPREMVLSSSEDGVRDWSPRVPLFRDPGYYNAYAGVAGTGADASDLGRAFYLYYLQWPSSDPNWDNARVMRRAVHCTTGQAAEEKPFVRYADAGRHIVTTGTPPAGYTREPGSDWRLLSTAQPGTRPLYGCRAGDADYFVSADAGCEGDQNAIVQTEGWIHTEKPSSGSSVALYRCHTEGLGDHFVSSDPDCEGGGVTQEGLLGYAATGGGA